MKETLKTAMRTSISEVFETMLFMSLELSDDNKLDAYKPSTTDLKACKLEFNGKLNGYFELYIPADLLLSTTESFLGEEQKNIAAEHADGTLMEILNMLGGNTFSTLDRETVYDLGIPTITDAQNLMQAEVPGGKDQIVIIIETIEGVMALRCVFA